MSRDEAGDLGVWYKNDPNPQQASYQYKRGTANRAAVVKKAKHKDDDLAEDTLTQTRLAGQKVSPRKGRAAVKKESGSEDDCEGSNDEAQGEEDEDGEEADESNWQSFVTEDEPDLRQIYNLSGGGVDVSEGSSDSWRVVVEAGDTLLGELFLLHFVFFFFL